MDEKNSDLAKAGLAAFAGELSPVLAAYRDQLVGRLAINDLQLNELRAQETTRRKNYSLVTGFVECLPGQTMKAGNRNISFRTRVPVEDAYMARQVQANVLWIKDISRLGMGYPYYIVGESPLAKIDEHSRRERSVIDLLLCSAVPQGEDDLKHITVLSDQYRSMQADAVKNVPSSFSYDDMKRMVDSTTGMLLPERLGYVMSARLEDYYLRKRASRKTTPEAIKRDGMQAVNKYWHTGKTLEDKDFAKFDIFTHLNLLAVAFMKVDELAALIDSSKTDESKTPFKQLTENE